MKDIFTDLYKKLAGFFQTPPEKENIKELACNRLRLVLTQDRTNLTPQLLERMRGEMIELLSKYVEMDKEALELNFAQEGDSMALMLSIPVIIAKDEEEIQAILDEEEKTKSEKHKEIPEPENLENDSTDFIDSTESEEEMEEMEEDITEEMEEEVCSYDVEEEEPEDSPESPDEVEEVSEQKSKKRNKE